MEWRGLVSSPDKNMEGVLVIMGGARTPSETCLGTLEQGTEPKNALVGPCNEPATPPGVNVPLPICAPSP